MGQSAQKIVQCRICKGDHWTTKCPYKDQLEVIQAQVKEDEAKSAADAGNKLELPPHHLEDCFDQSRSSQLATRNKMPHRFCLRRCDCFFLCEKLL